MSHAIDDIRERLASIAEELADVAIDRLQAGLGGDEHEAARTAANDKRLGRARRAVEKAVAELDGID